MKAALRIFLITAGVAAIVFVGLNWVAPICLSYYAAKKALPITKIVPVDLADHSIAAAATKLSYVGYEFQVPWNDLDDSQTKLYPSQASHPNRAVLNFRSGLRLMVTAVPQHEWANNLAEELKVSPQALSSVFGEDTMKSDYNFIKAMYDFTPDKIDHWAAFRGNKTPDQLLLIIKSIAPAKAAESGIFNLQNSEFKGFQQGDPRGKRDGVVIDMYAEGGTVEITFFQKNYAVATGLTQAEINCIVQTVHKIPADIVH